MEETKKMVNRQNNKNDNKQVNKKSLPISLPLKPIVFGVSILMSAGIFYYCATTFGRVHPSGFSSEAFYAPLRILKQLFLIPTIFIIIISIALTVFSLKNKKFWYLPVASILLISGYWYFLNSMVINIIKKQLGL